MSRMEMGVQKKKDKECEGVCASSACLFVVMMAATVSGHTRTIEAANEP